MSANKNNEENPNEKLPIPKWINEDYFRPILVKDHPDLKRIVKFIVHAATGPGENYTSVMVRVNIEIELKDSSSTLKPSYILKTTLPNSQATALLTQMNIFPKESEIYQIILPRFEKFYKEAGKIVTFGPQCKLSENLPERTTIVMEDLRQKKFKNINRCLGLDMNHMKEVLKKLAQFHAASIVHYERFGPFSKHFCQSFFNDENRKFFEERGKAKRKQFHDAMKKWGGCEKYIELWPDYEKTIKWFIEHESATNELTVLNHGDCWSNNIMFQYNEQNEIQETYFVDFQMCKWGTPAQDLYYLITSSAAYDIKVAEFDKLIRIYHENLVANMKLLNYSKSIPTLKDMHILMIKYSLWGFFTGINTMVVILLDPTEKANIDSYMNDDEFQRTSLMNPRFIKAMKQLLPWWENRGVFEI